MTQVISAQQIKAEAQRIGFAACGIVPSETVDEQNSLALRQWLSEGKQAGMEYMSNHLEKRLAPSLLLEDTRSIISVALNYYPPTLLKDEQYQFAWYAYGKDYHDTMKAKLAQLQEYIATLSLHPLQSRLFCDTAPLLERYWAWRAGLGWIGKNTQLVIPQQGSYFFLAELLIDKEVDTYDEPLQNRCGNCTRCLNACPTKAIEAPYVLQSGRCLSYLTIECRDTILPVEGFKIENCIYGCDECQKVCPHNRFATPCKTPELHPSEAFMQMTKEDWKALTEEQYQVLFKGSAVKRAKYTGLMRNIKRAEEEEKKGHPEPQPETTHRI